MFRTVIKPIKLFCLDSSNIRQLNISPIGIETIFFFGIGSGIEKHEEEDSGQIFLGQMLPDKLNSFTKLVFDCLGLVPNSSEISFTEHPSNRLFMNTSLRRCGKCWMILSILLLVD